MDEIDNVDEVNAEDLAAFESGPSGSSTGDGPRFNFHFDIPPTPVAPKYEYTVQNIVSTADMCCALDLRSIATRIRNAEYNPKRFRAVIVRIYEPRTTAMIFSSGKIVVTGAKSEALSLTAARKFKMILKKIGNEVVLERFKIQNIVSTVDIRFPIDLEKLATAHCQFASYDPDFFPAVIYRMVQPRTVLLIFVSGKIIVTGAKSREDIDSTMSNIIPVLESFRKPSLPVNV